MTLKCPVGDCGLEMPKDDFPAHMGEEHRKHAHGVAKDLRHSMEPKLAQRVEKACKPSPELEHAKPACT